MIRSPQAGLAAEQVIVLMEPLTAEQRMDVVAAIASTFCLRCGENLHYQDRSCQCWNDE